MGNSFSTGSDETPPPPYSNSPQGSPPRGSPPSKRSKRKQATAAAAAAPPPPLHNLHVQNQTPNLMQQQMQRTPSRRGGRGRRGGPAPPAGPAPAAIEVAGGKTKDEGHTVIAMVVDRSGSMQSMGCELEGGCNAYLEQQKKSDAEDGSRTTVSITTFDSEVEQLRDSVPLDGLPAVTADDVRPRGTTALYDAIGQTLAAVAAHVNGLDAAPTVVIFILTDGQENASRSWDKARVTADIERLQAEHGWDFYFAAANQDAMAEGSAIGMKAEQCMTYGFEGAKMASAMRSAQSAQVRGKRGGLKSFSPLERRTCA